MHLVAENGHSVCLKWLIDAGAGVGPLTKVLLLPTAMYRTNQNRTIRLSCASPSP